MTLHVQLLEMKDAQSKVKLDEVTIRVVAGTNKECSTPAFKFGPVKFSDSIFTFPDVQSLSKLYLTLGFYQTAKKYKNVSIIPISINCLPMNQKAHLKIRFRPLDNIGEVSATLIMNLHYDTTNKEKPFKVSEGKVLHEKLSQDIKRYMDKQNLNAKGAEQKNKKASNEVSENPLADLPKLEELQSLAANPLFTRDLFDSICMNLQRLPSNTLSQLADPDIMSGAIEVYNSIRGFKVEPDLM